MSLAGVVLCGGRSRRMGQDKASLAFRDAGRVYTMQSWMQERWARRLSPLLWAGPGQGCVPDHQDFAGQGPIAGVHAGLCALSEAKAGPLAMLLAVDMPEFEPSWVDALWAGMDDACLAVQFEGSSLLGALVRLEPVKALAEQLLKAQELRLVELMHRLAPRVLPAPADARPDALRSSMNRPEDFEQWLTRRGFEAVSPSL